MMCHRGARVLDGDAASKIAGAGVDRGREAERIPAARPLPGAWPGLAYAGRAASAMDCNEACSATRA